ncbi:MAG: fructosamine kinase family protein [Xanthomonadales bacterium]|jgi:fructosamine-3-kinase|nr:fructosamine kinase family protein [Xanthomonadales bacterium]
MNTPGCYPEILDRLGRGTPLELSPVGGGCIADSRIATFADGSSVFVKSAASAPDLFPREAEGLAALAGAGAIPVPRVLAVDSTALVLEHIRQGPRKLRFFESFGRNFARLHRFRGPVCGFRHDNYLGSTPQLNRPVQGAWPETPGNGDGSDWPEFFIERRLRFQVRLAADSGHGNRLQTLLDRAEARFNELLCAAIEPPAILHGDLWGGNFMADENGEACLIDPAVYFGHREADLAMTRLFGGFEPVFYEAYNDEWPLLAGHGERLPVYQLYHLLNHLNLFGSGYYRQCENILQRYAS